MEKKQILMSLLFVMALPVMMVHAFIQEDFEGQTPPSTNVPPAGWAFVNAEDQADTYYEVVKQGDNTAGRVKADVVVNGFYAAGYIVNQSPVPGASAFSGSYDMLVEDEGVWSDGLFLFGDILNGHTDNYFTFKYVSASSDMYQSDYPADSRIQVATTGFGIEFNVWYTTEFSWEPIDGTLGVMTLEVFDQEGLSLMSVSAEITLPEAVYFGLGSSNDAILIDNIDIGLANPPVQAFAPSPQDGVLLEATSATLSWAPGASAVAHNVYLGESEDAMTLIGDGLTETSLDVDSLAPGTTYYWRVDEINPGDADSPWVGNVWSFQVAPEHAYAPTPTDSAPHALTEPVLSWRAGMGALLHYVVFGTDADEVANAPATIMQLETTYSPGLLEPDTTYYWRVDEFTGAKTTKGAVWSFATVPVIEVTDETLLGHWPFDTPGAASALDVSGHGLHGATSGAPVWVDGVMNSAVEFDGSNDFFTTPAPADVNTPELSITAWIKPSEVNTGNRGLVFTRGPGSTTGLNLRAPGQLGYQWMAMAESWQFADGPMVKAGEWSFVAVVVEPDNATLYLNNVDLLAKNVVAHQPFVPNSGFVLGADPYSADRRFAGVIDDARVYTKALTNTELQALIDGAIVPEPEPDPMVLESFDGYRAYYAEPDPNVWDVWFDGYAGNGTGSTAGHDVEPFMERVLVVGGGQSMPLAYNNIGGTNLAVSEVSRDFVPAVDLTVGDAKSLVFSMRGNMDNIAEPTDAVYVILEDGTGRDVVPVGTAQDVTAARWTTMAVDLSTLTIDRTSLTKMTIAIGDPVTPQTGGSGKVYIDNIVLEN
jgi:hypothetical protein